MLKNEPKRKICIEKLRQFAPTSVDCDLKCEVEDSSS